MSLDSVALIRLIDPNPLTSGAVAETLPFDSRAQRVPLQTAQAGVRFIATGDAASHPYDALGKNVPNSGLRQIGERQVVVGQQQGEGETLWIACWHQSNRYFNFQVVGSLNDVLAGVQRAMSVIDEGGYGIE